MSISPGFNPTTVLGTFFYMVGHGDFPVELHPVKGYESSHELCKTGYGHRLISIAGEKSFLVCRLTQ